MTTYPLKNQRTESKRLSIGNDSLNLTFEQFSSMSASANTSRNNTKASEDGPDGSKGKEQKKHTAQMEEDDEFEDFPVEGRLFTPIGIRMDPNLMRA